MPSIQSTLVASFLDALLNPYQTFVITLMTILAPKLLIKLRAEYYGPIGEVATDLSWNAELSGHSQGRTEGYSDADTHTFELE